MLQSLEHLATELPLDMNLKIKKILYFWFVETTDEKKFQKDIKFDQVIKDRFLNDYKLASQNKLDDWQDTDRDCLALIILLDQFSRNLFRESGKASMPINYLNTLFLFSISIFITIVTCKLDFFHHVIPTFINNFI